MKILLAISCFAFLVEPLHAETVPAIPTPPSCICSKAVAATYAKGKEKSEVYIANCSCPPQQCATTWSTDSKYAGVSLACSSELPVQEATNCIDFTRLQKQEIKEPKSFSSFEITPSSQQASRARIMEASITDETGKEISYPPYGLTFDPALSIYFPSRSTKLDITYVAGMGGGFGATWLNDRGEYKRITQGESDTQHKVLTRSIIEPNGFNGLTLLSTEHSYLKICAYRDEPGNRSSPTSTNSK